MNLEKQMLDAFLDITKQSVSFTNEWRRGKKDILSKINVNGQLDVVTTLDRQIEENAKNKLCSIFPDFKFVGEESFSGDYEVFKHNYIVMDPIDGTRPFTEGSCDWSISICAVIDGEAKVGILLLPDKSLTITAIKGCGLKLNGVQIDLMRQTLNSKIGVSPRQLDKVNITLNKSKFMPSPMSALTPKIAAIICGEIDGAIYYPETGKSASIWDYAAANFLINEGGGVIKSFTGQNLPYKGIGVIHKGGWIAAKNDEIFEKIKSYIDTVEL